MEHARPSVGLAYLHKHGAPFERRFDELLRLKCTACPAETAKMAEVFCDGCPRHYLCGACDERLHFPFGLARSHNRKLWSSILADWQPLWDTSVSGKQELFVWPLAACARCGCRSEWKKPTATLWELVTLSMDGPRVFKAGVFECGVCGLCLDQREPSACNMDAFPLASAYSSNKDRPGEAVWANGDLLDMMQSQVQVCVFCFVSWFFLLLFLMVRP
jgi:hypothetical protein